MTTLADDRLLHGTRIIRSLVGPPESPWPGTLAVFPSGQSRILVDAGQLGDDWAGWHAATSGHVLAPVDVLRVDGGHVVALPVCLEPLRDLIARRESAGARLTEGERLTVCVSVIRGLAELASCATGRVTGAWWVTDAARPVFAAGSGRTEAPEETSDLLRSLATDAGRLSDAIAAAADLATDPARLAHEVELLEDELFASAVAEPLVLSVLSPRTARALSVHRDAPSGVAADPAEEEGWSRLARHVDADLADLFSRATTGAWRRLRTVRRPRGGPWVAAGVLAAAIVGGAALLPSAADEPPAAAPTPTDAAASEPGGASPPAPDPVGGEAPGDPAPISSDLETIASTLLEDRIACGGDVRCLEGVAEDPGVQIPAGAVDLPAARRKVRLLDEFGGAAVLRVESDDDSSSAQLIVVVQTDDGWRLRDVHDVAEPPS